MASMNGSLANPQHTGPYRCAGAGHSRLCTSKTPAAVRSSAVSALGAVSRAMAVGVLSASGEVTILVT